MKTKLIFATATKNNEQWTDLPFIPRTNEWFNVQDILVANEIAEIKASARSWSGVRGMVRSVEYRHDDNEFYAEVIIRCEDNTTKK
jgi:hypothetical protein